MFWKDLFSAARFWTRERWIQWKMESPAAKLHCQLSQDGKKNIYVDVRSRRVIGGHHKAIPQLGILNSMGGANSRHSLEHCLHSALCSLPPVFTWTTISRINKKILSYQAFWSCQSENQSFQNVHRVLLSVSSPVTFESRVGARGIGPIIIVSLVIALLQQLKNPLYFLMVHPALDSTHWLSLSTIFDTLQSTSFWLPIPISSPFTPQRK